jgi:hypothetical protein
LLVLVASIASADGPEWDDVELVELGKWQDPGGYGPIVQIDQTSDGDRLLVLASGSPDRIRITDRDLDTLAVLEPPHEDPLIEGAHWTDSGDWVYAWGSAEGVDHDLLWMWNTTDYRPSDWLFENYTTPLQRLYSAVFMPGDEILALAGRDDNGTSRVLIVETHTSDVRRDYPWEDNATVVRVGTDMMVVICLDERGTISTVGGSDWTSTVDLGGNDVAPSSDTLGLRDRLPWLVGYEDGGVSMWGGNPPVHERSTDFGDGPVQGLSWAMTDSFHYYMVAVPSASGGSVLSAYFYHLNEYPDYPASVPVEFTAPVTYMLGDIMVAGQVWIGFQDGTVRLMNASIIHNMIPVVTIEVPEFQKDYTEDFTATGIVTDDLDRLEYVRVLVGDGNWTPVEVTEGRWSYRVDVSKLSGGEGVFRVEAFDGKHLTENRTFFQLPPEDDDEDKWGERIPWITLVVVIIALVPILLWRLRGGKAEGTSNH